MILCGRGFPRQQAEPVIYTVFAFCPRDFSFQAETGLFSAAFGLMRRLRLKIQKGMINTSKETS